MDDAPPPEKVIPIPPSRPSQKPSGIQAVPGSA